MKNGWQVRELRLTVQRWQRLRASKAMEVRHDISNHGIQQNGRKLGSMNLENINHWSLGMIVFRGHWKTYDHIAQLWLLCRWSAFWVQLFGHGLPSQVGSASLGFKFLEITRSHSGKGKPLPWCLLVYLCFREFLLIWCGHCGWFVNISPFTLQWTENSEFRRLVISYTLAVSALLWGHLLFERQQREIETFGEGPLLRFK